MRRAGNVPPVRREGTAWATRHAGSFPAMVGGRYLADGNRSRKVYLAGRAIGRLFPPPPCHPLLSRAFCSKRKSTPCATKCGSCGPGGRRGQHGAGVVHHQTDCAAAPRQGVGGKPGGRRHLFLCGAELTEGRRPPARARRSCPVKPRAWSSVGLGEAAKSPCETENATVPLVESSDRPGLWRMNSREERRRAVDWGLAMTVNTRLAPRNTNGDCWRRL